MQLLLFKRNLADIVDNKKADDVRYLRPCFTSKVSLVYSVFEVSLETVNQRRRVSADVATATLKRFVCFNSVLMCHIDVYFTDS